jgi:hypothetical protein
MNKAQTVGKLDIRRFVQFSNEFCSARYKIPIELPLQGRTGPAYSGDDARGSSPTGLPTRAKCRRGYARNWDF